MPTKDDILGWLGDGWKVRLRTVAQSDWRNQNWRAEFLASNVVLELYHVHDEADSDGKRVIYFATPTA